MTAATTTNAGESLRSAAAGYSSEANTLAPSATTAAHPGESPSSTTAGHSSAANISASRSGTPAQTAEGPSRQPGGWAHDASVANAPRSTALVAILAAVPPVRTTSGAGYAPQTVPRTASAAAINPPRLPATRAMDALTVGPVRHPAPARGDLQDMQAASVRRLDLWEDIRWHPLASAFLAAGVVLPPRAPSDLHALNRPLQAAMSAFIRRTRMPLPQFVELVRGQTSDDYRPNKALQPEVLRHYCQHYERIDDLTRIAAEGTRVTLTAPLPPQSRFPRNHPSAGQRITVLRTNIRKEQDTFYCLVVDEDIIDVWPELFVSPYGVVDKGGGDPRTTGRVIHDLSFPENNSVNSHTEQTYVPKASFEHCSSVAREVIRCRDSVPDCDVMLIAGDVATAYRNASTHSESVYMFAGHIPEDKAIVIDLSAAFGWTGSSGAYSILGGAVAMLHGSATNADHPEGFFNNHWVDDHVNVTSNRGTNCADINRSLRWAMAVVMGPSAVNEDKFTSWSTRLQVLGLIFGTAQGTVSMPPSKIATAKLLVASAFHAHSLTRREYRSLLGSLRHVATCIRPARVFLQRLRARERHVHRIERLSLSPAMRNDLLWWWQALESPSLNGIPLEYFNDNPAPDITVITDASDVGLCAIAPSLKLYLTYRFSSLERQLISDFRQGAPNEFDINYRELLACAFAVQRWAPQWQRQHDKASPLHVHFRIDNTSAVAWQSKMASPNTRAQLLVRLLGVWELRFGLRISSSHIPGSENTMADAGSRQWGSVSHARLFQELTLGWQQAPSPKSIADIETAWNNISANTPLRPPPSRPTPGRSTTG